MRFVFLVCVHLFVGVGVIGLAVPLLPTTPFLLLALVCYGKSSEKFYHALLDNRWCGKALEDWLQERSISFRNKAKAIALIAIVIPCGVIISPHLVVKLLLGSIGLCVTIFIVTRHTKC